MDVHFDAEVLLTTIDCICIVSVDMAATVAREIIAELEGLVERNDRRLVDFFITKRLRAAVGTVCL